VCCPKRGTRKILAELKVGRRRRLPDHLPVAEGQGSMHAFLPRVKESERVHCCRHCDSAQNVAAECVPCAKPAYLMMPHLAVQPRLVIHCSSPQRCCLYLHKIARHSMQGFASSLSCLAKQELIQGATQDCTYLTKREDTDSIIGQTNE